MKNIILEAYESALNEMEETEKPSSIAIVPGSFKPPHAGHFDMVQKYSKIADKVIVLISDPKKDVRGTKTGTIISPEISKKIFEIYLKRYGLKNVEVKISEFPSPLTAAFDFIENELHDVKIYLGASKKDGDWKRYSGAKRYFYDKLGRTDIEIVDPEEAAVSPFESNGVAISATFIRDNIDDPKAIRPMFPSELTDADFAKIMKLLNS